MLDGGLFREFNFKKIILDSPNRFPSLSGEGDLVPPYGESVGYQDAGENKYAS